MPNVDIHCKISKARTQGDEFRELHEWIDAPQKDLGINHRIERHSLNDIYLKYIEKHWGKSGVIEWLFHIAIDNMETANMFAVDLYPSRCYNQVLMGFNGKKLGCCSFVKPSGNANSVNIK